MKNRITQKIVSDGLHTYGKVSWVGGQGKQFVFPFNYQTGPDKYGFQFLFFAYGKKSDVVRKISEVLNTMSDEEITKLHYIECDQKVPITLRSGTGLNCF